MGPIAWYLARNRSLDRDSLVNPVNAGGMMIRLRTFGGLGIDPDGASPEELPLPRKALALLALVAVHGAVGRERIMALLWPESSEERARGSLNQALHLLRRQLDAPDLLLGTSELRLNPERIDADVRRFLDALSCGELATAAEVYRGPFLEAVHIEADGEFERWVEAEREVLARRHLKALEGLARAAVAAGDQGAAVEWWRRVQGADPLNTPVALELIDALERAGDPAGALRHARVHQLLLRDQVGLPPDPELSHRVARLQGVNPPPGLPPPVPPSVRTTSSRGALLAAAGGLAALTLLLWLVARAVGPAPESPTGATIGPGPVGHRASVAVLPFVDMSPDGSLEHWADGLSEEILNTLARFSEIRLPARTSSFHFKGRNVPVREIAELLGVDHVLDGSLRSTGGQLRISAQLVNARDDRHLWSATFDRDPADVFAVQEEIARTVAEALRVEFDLTGTASSPPFPPSAEAHELYLRGLLHWHRRSTPDLLLAIRHFEEATRLEPHYARPWAGLALLYAGLPTSFVLPVPIEVARARLEETARRALDLDPSLAEVHAALGLGYHFDWRWDDAEREFLRALELNPRLPTAHQWYAAHQAKTLRPAEARASILRALELDPLSPVIRNDVGLIHLLNRDFSEAREAWLGTLAEDPSFIIPQFLLHRLDLMEGDLDGAEEWGRRWATLTGAMTVDEITLLTRAVGDPQLRPAALGLLDEWESAPGPRWHDLAFHRVVLGDAEGAIRALSRGTEERAPMMTQLVNLAWFDPLREDPDFRALLAQVAPWYFGAPRGGGFPGDPGEGAGRRFRGRSS
jgi:adenylate cyclase